MREPQLPNTLETYPRSPRHHRAGVCVVVVVVVVVIFLSFFVSFFFFSLSPFLNLLYCILFSCGGVFLLVRFLRHTLLGVMFPFLFLLQRSFLCVRVFF